MLAHDWLLSVAQRACVLWTWGGRSVFAVPPGMQTRKGSSGLQDPVCHAGRCACRRWRHLRLDVRDSPQ
jgi:hypothetical protein